jgi:hypothetical protein
MLIQVVICYSDQMAQRLKGNTKSDLNLYSYAYQALTLCALAPMRRLLCHKLISEHSKLDLWRIGIRIKS